MGKDLLKGESVVGRPPQLLPANQNKDLNLYESELMWTNHLTEAYFYICTIWWFGRFIWRLFLTWILALLCYSVSHAHHIHYFNLKVGFTFSKNGLHATDTINNELYAWRATFSYFLAIAGELFKLSKEYFTRHVPR